MQILQGDVQYYIPQELSGALQLIGKYKGKNIKEVQNSVRWDMVSAFEQQKENFFVDEIGGDIILNPTINKVISFFINTLYSINPKAYQNNLTNYNNIQKYFGITQDSSQNFTWESVKGMINTILSNTKQWIGETQILNKLFHK